MPQKISRKSLLLALALFGVPGQAGADQSSSTQISITGVAWPVCQLPSPKAAGSSYASFDNSTVTFTQFLDPQTALVQPSNITLRFAGAMCNYNANVSLSSKNGGLVSSSTPTALSGAGSFLQIVPYTVTAAWGTVGVTLDTSTGTSATAPAGGANAADLTLTIATQKSALPVMQGVYQDTLIVKIGAQL